MIPQFVSTAWLAEHLHDPNLIVFDCSWYLPAEARDPHAEYLTGHIPGAVLFDIDAIADKTTDLPHMLPKPDDFGRMAGALGVSNDMTIVVYDEIGVRSAARVWWEFEAMGATDVRVLNGGGPKWRGEGRPIEAGTATKPPRTFVAKLDANLVADAARVRALVGDPAAQVLDARPPARFAGEAPEPRPGLKGGHIPGSRNIPVATLWDGSHLKSETELKAMFDTAGIDLERPIVTTCGSGITASTLALALRKAGARNVAVYDGSWAEWGALADTPVATRAQ